MSSISQRVWSVGIGDDAAVRKINSQRFELITQDILLEKIHFKNQTAQDFRNLGWKSLAVNLSDIAAMGGVPMGAVIGLGIPPSATVSEIDHLYRGLGECSKKFKFPIVGGDTNRSKSGWVIAVTVLGESNRVPLLRKGAKVGDTLWVTGTLGDAALGFKLKQQQKAYRTNSHFSQSLERPTPRLTWGEEFLHSGLVTSMIDLSDGLVGDTRHLMEASRVGFEIELEKIPRDPRFHSLCKKYGYSPNFLLLEGGEDYELLFTVKKSLEKKFVKFLKNKSIEATCIGRAVRKRRIVFLENGRRVKQVFKGFQHF
jgi:thiamine-monophosphate kinase